VLGSGDTRGGPEGVGVGGGAQPLKKIQVVRNLRKYFFQEGLIEAKASLRMGAAFYRQRGDVVFGVGALDG